MASPSGSIAPPINNMMHYELGKVAVHRQEMIIVITFTSRNYQNYWLLLQQSVLLSLRTSPRRSGRYTYRADSWLLMVIYDTFTRQSQPVSAFPSLPQPILPCSNLSKPAPTFFSQSHHPQTCPNMPKPVQTCRNLPKPAPILQ